MNGNRELTHTRLLTRRRPPCPTGQTLQLACYVDGLVAIEDLCRVCAANIRAEKYQRSTQYYELTNREEKRDVGWTKVEGLNLQER